MSKNDNIIDGYLFTSKGERERAKKEALTIQKLRDTTDINNIEHVFELYTKMVSKDYFSTPVGLGFLHEMWDYLRQFYNEEDLKPVPVPERRVEKKLISSEFNIQKYDKLKKENQALINLKKKLIIAVVAMVVVIVGMFFIIITNDNLGYFNAEDKVLNKYAAWEERLAGWEEELIKREEMLNNQLNQE